MHVRLTHGETRQNFNIWVYGEERLVRGSGLYVGETGVATNHHFLLPEDAPQFRFSAGAYKVDLYARVLGDRRHHLLFTQNLEVTESLAQALVQSDAGIYFDWGPDSSHYYAHADLPPTRNRDEHLPEFLAALLPELREQTSSATTPRKP